MTGLRRRVLFLVLGGYTLTIQIVLVRECFALFAGNELSLAVQLGLWLGLTAIGGLAASRRGPGAPALLVALPLAGVAAPAVVRLAPLLLPVATGEEVPLGCALLCLVVAQAPINLVAGALFPAACRHFAGPDEASAIGRFYTFEALGGAVGGIAVTLLLSGVRGLDLAVGAGAAVAIIAVILTRGTGRVVAATSGLVLAGLGIFLDPAEFVDDLWWQQRRPGFTRLTTFETRYQRIDVARHLGQHTIYSNGAPLLTIPDTSEPTSGHRFADLALSLHPGPQRILIVGNGEPGLVARTLEYDLQRVDYVLLDPGLLPALGAAAVWSGEDSRLSILGDRGRQQARPNSAQGPYDLIVLDLPAPVSAAGNRFFTREAFVAARSQLGPGGLLVLSLPSSPAAIGDDSEMLLAAVYRGLVEAFAEVDIIAGDSLVLVAGGPPVLPVEQLAARFASRGVAIRLAGGRTVTDPVAKEAVFGALYEPQFSPFRRAQQLALLASSTVVANSDRRPVAYYLNLRRWLRLIGWRCDLSESLILAVLAGFLVVGFLALVIASRRRRGQRAVLAVAVLSSGWAGMMGEVALVFAYQNRFGCLYHNIGALFAVYMLGLVSGSILTARSRLGLGGILVIRVAMAGTCLGSLGVVLAEAGSAALFGALFVYALALGSEYPLANRVFRQASGGRAAAGILHSMDHFGAAGAALLAGTLVLPLLGATTILLAVACLHLLMAIALGVLGYSLT